MRIFSVLMLLVVLCGCQTMRIVDHGNWSSLKGQVEAGDTVEVVTTDGRVLNFVVTEVTEDALVSADARVPRAEISRLQVLTVHKGKTFGATFGAGAVAVGIMILAAAASLMGGWRLALSRRFPRPAANANARHDGRASNDNFGVRSADRRIQLAQRLAEVDDTGAAQVFAGIHAPVRGYTAPLGIVLLGVVPGNDARSGLAHAVAVSEPLFPVVPVIALREVRGGIGVSRNGYRLRRNRAGKTA